MIDLQEYAADQIEGQARYRELIRDYEERARGSSSTLGMELDRLECDMLDTPPVYTNGLGELAIRKTGLLMPSSADLIQARGAPMGDFQVRQLCQSAAANNCQHKFILSFRPLSGCAELPTFCMYGRFMNRPYGFSLTTH